MRTCAFISFRLGGTDGVAVVARQWQDAFRQLGWNVVTIAGADSDHHCLDHIVPGLELGATQPPKRGLLSQALADADLVVAENILSLPLNSNASRLVGELLAGKPTIAHHHDLPWQLPRFVSVSDFPLHDPAWRHVVINNLSVTQLAARGLDATCIYNTFNVNVERPDKAAARRRLGFAVDERVVLHPVRAIARKNIGVALKLAEELDAVYWITGAIENNYNAEFSKLVSGARCPIRHASAPSMSDAYAASDLVVFPSIWEGFGNPPLEAAVYLRPAAVGRYPVAAELRSFGFSWLDPTDPAAVASALEVDTDQLLASNRQLVATHFSSDRLAGDVERLLASLNF